MMKKTLVLCVALLASNLLFAKPYTQQGIAYLYDYKTKTKKPVANVSLTVAYAKGPAVSRADGTFTIEFQDFGAGKKLAFEKQPFSEGLTVLNKKEVDEWSTFEGKLTLIMCNKKDFDDCKQRYYDVGLQSVTQRYERKIAALKQESADYQQRLQELEEERDRILDNLRNSADAMARIDQSKLDAVMQEVLDLYEQGNVDEAMKKLEDMKLEEKFIQTLDKKHEAERDSVLLLNKLRTSVDMYKNSGNWDKVSETLKLLADKLNTYEEIFAYAQFCYNQHDFKDAEIYYGRALKFCQNLAKDNPKVYNPDLAQTLNNLAILYEETRRFTEAEEMYKQALAIRHRLAKDNPEAYEPIVAITLNNLAILYRNTRRFTEAEEMYKQALVIRHRLAKDNPAVYEPDLAQTLKNLADLYEETRRFTEAEEMYKQALEFFQRLAKENPKVYEPDMAMTLFTMAILYDNTQRRTEAEEMKKRALEIYQRLAKDNPKAYEFYVSVTLGSLSFNAILINKYPEAEQLAREGLEVDSTQHWIASNLAAALLFQGKYSEAEPIYRQYKDELKEGFLDDFKQFKVAGVIPKEREEDVAKIKRMLEE